MTGRQATAAPDRVRLRARLGQEPGSGVLLPAPGAGARPRGAGRVAGNGSGYGGPGCGRGRVAGGRIRRGVLRASGGERRRAAGGDARGGLRRRPRQARYRA